MAQLKTRLHPTRGVLCAGLLFIAAASPPVSVPKDDPPTPTASAPPTATPTSAVSASPTPVPSTVPASQIASDTPSTHTSTPSQTPTEAEASVSPTAPLSATLVPSAISTETLTPFPETTPSPTNTTVLIPTATATHTPTPTPSLTPPGSTFPPLTVMISEVAWAGTLASAYDEWIELHNPGDQAIDLEGWRLTDGDDLQIPLHGTIAAFGFFLLERSDDTTIANISADAIYTGSLRNDGERLELRDPSGALIDTANLDGGGWPAGDSASRYSMERRGGDDRPGNWATFPGTGGNGIDASGLPVGGSPRQPNAIWFPAEPTPSATATPSPPPPTPSGTPHALRSVLINEVAWAGSAASSSDEWIELLNTTSSAIDLQGWALSDGQDINIALSGSIAPHAYYLLERTDDATVADITADLIYSGSLRNTGERLILQDPFGKTIDSANQSGGAWPAGNPTSHASMERRGGGDSPGNWGTFTGFFGIGRDAAGNAIQGTPLGVNSLHFPTPQPTWIPGRIVINEVLIRPHYDWQGNGGVNPDDEFIELYNLGPFPVNLRGWALDDLPGAGSSPFELPGRTVPPGGFVVFFRSKTHIALNDTGDTVRLLDPSGNLIDSISYLGIRAPNLSYGRLPDGSGQLAYGLWPTARGPNLLFVDALQYVRNETRLICPPGAVGALRIPRVARPAVLDARPFAAPQLSCTQNTTPDTPLLTPEPLRVARLNGR